MSDQANIKFGHIPIPGIMSVILELSSALLLFSLTEEESKLIWTIKETTAHISSASTVSVIAKLSALHTTAQMAVSGRKKAYLNHFFLFLRGAPAANPPCIRVYKRCVTPFPAYRSAPSKGSQNKSAGS